MHVISYQVIENDGVVTFEVQMRIAILKTSCVSEASGLVLANYTTNRAEMVPFTRNQMSLGINIILQIAPC